MSKGVAREAVEIRNEIRKTEAALDESLRQTSRLFQRVLQGRQHPQIRVNAGQAALSRIVSAQQRLFDITNEIFEAHAELSRVAKEYGIGDESGSTVPTGVDNEVRAKAVELA